MLPLSRLAHFWQYAKWERNFTSPRHAILRAFIFGALLCVGFYFVCFSFYYVFASYPRLRKPESFALKVEEDALKHFIGSRECSISLSDIYLAPFPQELKLSPFCKNRAELVTAFGDGGRHGFDGPYVGKGCTYRWFPTQEICMILERFNALIFIGDELAQSTYAAFNILLREDLLYGGLQQWRMNEADKGICKCDGQFLRTECVEFGVKNMEDVRKNQDGGKGSSAVCNVPHAFLPLKTIPASSSFEDQFKELTYNKLNPWQPSPIIFSFSRSSSLSTIGTTAAIDELMALALAAERNIPMLFLGPTIAGLGNGANIQVWKYQNEMVAVSEEKHFEMLRFFNLTIHAGMVDGRNFGEKIALVQAMIVINWLAMLETS
ncbi:hypothetical protein BGZ60DRAFT_18156 [Tricladium varicosporioides]|nr:hypothetical protein BGZ60DRAFT_18156 [Hymenoscyphus varicosporioides]